MSNIPTPHIECNNKSIIADTVLMPGDPLRAKYIADTYLSDVKTFNTVRNMLGFTGFYKGKRISVMGSGMGMPSIGIYAYELYKFYDVKRIIRIGSSGAYTSDLNAFDIVLVNKAYTDSNFALNFLGKSIDTIESSEKLNSKILESAKSLNINILKATVHSTDQFYRTSDDYFPEVLKKGCKVVDMESFALYLIASYFKKEAACILTISDSFVKPVKISSKEREQNFNQMIEIALNTNY